jgi:hypothetical protein
VKATAYGAYDGPVEAIELPEPELVPRSALLEVLAVGPAKLRDGEVVSRIVVDFAGAAAG